MARLVGGLALAFLLFMLLGHLFGSANGPEGMRFTRGSDVVAFVLFPIGTIIGLALAYWRPMAGGAIAAGSVLVLLVLRPALLPTAVGVMVLPGLLHVAVAWMRRRAVR